MRATPTGGVPYPRRGRRCTRRCRCTRARHVRGRRRYRCCAATGAADGVASRRCCAATGAADLVASRCCRRGVRRAASRACARRRRSCTRKARARLSAPPLLRLHERRRRRR